MNKSSHAYAAIRRRRQPATPYMPAFGLNPAQKITRPVPRLEDLDDDISDLLAPLSGQARNLNTAKAVETNPARVEREAPVKLPTEYSSAKARASQSRPAQAKTKPSGKVILTGKDIPPRIRGKVTITGNLQACGFRGDRAHHSEEFPPGIPS